MKKLVRCFTASITLVSIALTGCVGAAKPASSDAPGTTSVQAEKIAFENVYTETPLPVEFHGYGNSMLCAGERIYYSTTLKSESEPDGTDAATVTQRLMSCDLDGGDVKILWEQTAPAGEETLLNNTLLPAFDADADGNLWLVISGSHTNEADPNDPVYENTLNLVKLAPDGTELFNTDLLSKEGGELGGMYLYSMALDAAGNIYLHSQDIHVFSAAGEYAFTLKEPSSIRAMTVTNTGEVIYVTTDATGVGYEVKQIDFAARSAGAAVKYNLTNYLYRLFRGTGEYLFYCEGPSGLYGAKLDPAKSGAITGEKVIDFINSDISAGDGEWFAPIDGGGFIMTDIEFRSSGMTAKLSRLTENKNATLDGKTVLTLATVSGADASVMKFNKTSRTIRIIVKDYSEYNTPDDYNAGQARLDLDIVAGRVPDIISVRGQISKYTTKGVLEDLTPFLESEKHGVSRGDLFENILTLGSKDGKVYQIIPRFTMTTLIGKESVFGERESITAAELADIADARPEAAILSLATSADWLTGVMRTGISDYIDWYTGTCDFTSQEFIDTLEFSKRFPKEMDFNALYGDAEAYREYSLGMETTYSDERTLLIVGYVYGVRLARDMDIMFGEKTVMFGYPTAGTSGSVVDSLGGYAISASSSNKDAAWEFICSTIASAGETSAAMFGGIPLDKRQLEEIIATEMLPLEERDFTNGIDMVRVSFDGYRGTTLDSPEDIDMTDPYYKNYALTREEADRVLRAIEGADAVASSDEQISKIIMEEAEAFWAGAKTAEETASVIQSRAALYVSESS
ncbi:MAG: hypothetical protein LBK23_08660 [Oscillospiraceae bacterium]|jgi:ABC-type glycerol-3-phosphate transport system substrate-binding protein|nr:hypothetical protein [Oscillospiraceae bacterium]